jgi:DNA polymerase-1
MKRTWMLLDVNNLAYRAAFTTGRLSHGGDPTGVAFGIFRDIKQLKDRFSPHGFCFCFDHGKSLREKEFPYYKETRRKKKHTPEQQELRDSCRRQVEKLKFEWLGEMGYRNLFFHEGYEADDIIASVVHNLDENEEAVIVSGDEDYYQLISQKVIVFHPRGQKVVNLKSFKALYGIHPRRWSLVKAIGGCVGDDVPGVVGVAEKTAAAYLRHGGLGDRKKEAAIKDYLKSQQYQDSLKLVQLPYEGCPRFVPVDDDTDPRKIRAVMEKLGIRSLDTRSGIRSFGLRF